MTAHSIIGASGAERWMHCPGSVGLLKYLEIGETSDDPDYRVAGTTAHAGAAHCLESGQDSWEIAGHGFDGEEFTGDMVGPVQLFLDTVRQHLTDTASLYVEHSVARPDIHPKAFSTLDASVIDDDTLYMFDYKNGAGIVVEVVDNPQIKYYDALMLNRDDTSHIKKIVNTIVQPNAYHPDGPVRTEETTPEAINEWTREVLVPAMKRAETDNTLDPGPWCRFCPAKLVCPVMQGLYAAIRNADPAKIELATDERLDREYLAIQAVKTYIKAHEERVLMRLLSGSTKFVNAKLVPKRSNRVWKDGAETKFKAEFGGKAVSQPELLSPAQMEKIAGKDMVHVWAFTPETGFTVAPATDHRPSITVKKASETFAEAIRKLQAE